MRQSKVCGPRRVYARAVPTLSHEMVCVKGVVVGGGMRVRCRSCRHCRRFRRCHHSSGSRKVREPGDRVRSVGVRARPATVVPQPRVVEKQSGLRLRHWRRHRRRQPPPASRDGGHSVAHARGLRRSGGRTACWGGGRKEAERTQAGHLEAEDKPRRRAVLGFFCACFVEKNFTTKLPRTTLGMGLARTGTNTGTPREPPERLP